MFWPRHNDFPGLHNKLKRSTGESNNEVLPVNNKHKLVHSHKQYQQGMFNDFFEDESHFYTAS